jgi:aminoglycoside 3-N-acetyltransferase
LRQLLKNIIPTFLLEWYRQKKRDARQRLLERDKKSGQIFTTFDLLIDLQKAGVKAGSVLMVHSSLSKMGFVDGGAETVIQALLKQLGSSGTLVMPSFPGMGFNADYLKTNPIFDVNKTPSRMGIITETFRQYKNVMRSWHPTEPVCALGVQAEYLTNAHHLKDTPYHNMSPFMRLCELNASILLIGVDLNSLTNLHTSEDAIPNFRYSIYLKEKIKTTILHQQVKLDYDAYCHNPTWSKKRKCNDLIPHFKAAGFLKEVKIGKALSYLINAKAMHDWLVENYHSKNITMYTPNGETSS